MKKLILLLVFLITVNISCLYADQIREYKLDNGLDVFFIEDHKAPIATFQIWYKVGSRNEPAGKTGISHLLEHMMFKGTPQYGSKEFSQIIQKNGGINNAYTTKDNTVYYQNLASDRLYLSIKLEADRMQNLLLNSREVRSEKSVVMEERRLRYEDDPQNALFEEVSAAAFKAHPYHNPVIGWMADIEAIERTDLNNYYKRFYAPENAFIVVSGDINPEETINIIRKHFGLISQKSLQPVPDLDQESRSQSLDKAIVKSIEPQQRGERRVYLKKQAQLPFIIIAYHVPSVPHEDSYALDILSTILSGKSGRLYQRLIKGKKIALNAFASYSGTYIDPYLFYFGGTSPPGKDINSLENAFYTEIQKLIYTPVTDREIGKAKNQTEAYFIMGQDSISFKARLLGDFEMLGDWRLKDIYIEKIKEVTSQDVQRVAKKYLTQDNRTVGILIPQE